MNGWWLVPLGVAAGASQALMLGRAARGEVRAGGVLLRLFLVGAVLYAAALWEHLLAGAGGWAAGFVGSAVMVVRRLR